MKYSRTQNVYQYSSLNLIISYTAALALSISSIALGIFSILDNGVAHSTAFSAVMATTRNANIDELMSGHTLGVVPLANDVSKARLRFGELATMGNRMEQANRIGFGFEDAVRSLEKFGKYM